MPVSVKIGLKVGDYTFVGFKEIIARKSLNEIACSFALMTTEFAEGNFSKWKVKLDDVAKVYINDKLFCTGYIDTIIPVYNNYEKFITFKGRGKTCDLVDCSYDGSQNEWKNITVKSIIENLCKPYNIEVKIDKTAQSESLKQVLSFKATESLFVYDMINDLCREYGILPVDIGDGKLTIMKSTSTEKTKDSIDNKINSAGGALYISNVDRYKTYKVKGVGIGTQNKQLKDYISPTGSVSDSAISRARTLTIFSDRPTDNGSCKNRATYEARIRAGNSRFLTYEMPIVQSDGSLWDINKLVKVKDTLLGVDDTLLISTVECSMVNSGSQGTTLTLVDKDTYSGSTKDIDIKTIFG